MEHFTLGSMVVIVISQVYLSITVVFCSTWVGGPRAWKISRFLQYYTGSWRINGRQYPYRKNLSNTFSPFFQPIISHITEMAIDDISQNRQDFYQFTSIKHYSMILILFLGCLQRSISPILPYQFVIYISPSV
ncbi:hypothetical protein F5Y08DRAFT_250548 [Xylaria arbuscula]|nr:hypothetical protein F5Y08DRAFT_250548 [Xylaria arbuscula]